MTSDSSDDEDLTKLREATDTQFINDSMFNKKQVKTTKELRIQTLPSLRRSKDEDEQFNLFRVTPEFRNYVAQKLSTILDKKLIYENSNYDTYMKPKKRKSGIKLLRESENYIKKVKIEDSKYPKTKPTISNLQSDDDDEKYKSVAVSPDDILNKKDVKFWSTRTKAPIYNYVKTKNGLILK